MKTVILDFLRAIRIHQWVKNSLLFLPIIMAHEFNNVENMFTTLLAFISFSFCASAVYILNDILDIESDKKHPIKKSRPFASGKFSISTGIIILIAMLIMGLIIAVLYLSTTFVMILLSYMIITTLYSMILKKLLIIDVIILGGLYTARIVAGAVASTVGVSSWLLVFSLFFFLSLAFMKRYADLIIIKEKNEGLIAGRGYSIKDIDLVQKSGITSGFVSILVFALYINSGHVAEMYSAPILLWLALPILLYWLMNMWAATIRGEMVGDPIVFAIKDKISYISIVLIIIIIVLAATVDNSILNNFHIIL